MKEIPNLNYLNALSDGDQNIKLKLIAILKEEFPQELENYNNASHTLNYIEMAELVHKLSHKIGFFGLEIEHQKAQLYQQALSDFGTTVKGRRADE